MIYIPLPSVKDTLKEYLEFSADCTGLDFHIQEPVAVYPAVGIPNCITECR